MRTILVALVVCCTSPALALAEYWTFRDWSVQVERVDTGEDLRITCRASTGGDGDPVLEVYVSNGDAMPPGVFPWVSLRESAPRGYATLMRDGDDAVFTFDTGARLPAIVRGGFDGDGIPFAHAEIDETDNQAALRAMRKASNVQISRGSESVYTASLSGFTAAYGKIAEQCGFPTTGVFD